MSGQQHLLRLQMLSHEVDERLGLNLICRLAGQRTLNCSVSAEHGDVGMGGDGTEALGTDAFSEDPYASERVTSR
ncbi:hypothetical protein [Mesorhizobium sp. M7A.F.Ca.MR.245.00.0.0]|uniref:hypothetical protein n=1 Tax=Mesorhizobium sp. M7A.F.Ca.MR.245.00.0.0 TaxID=2496778 RepID=UPI000FCA2D9F|nr:hypothetical protein [Mesorhizobium sp. M7A.F.Ca.MR.245.00.0.0]RUV20099.1 hypothetical protein EOB80_16455 [Mesorhizobium sp. M7A.F.Ca.MR.245.00.0.0]RUV53860.1 hypothetical protein EOB77_00160 [Mesorhizobium sp. M7A.F.Ca.MR.228.00.0.0]